MPTTLTPKASLLDAFLIFGVLLLPSIIVNVLLYYLGLAINAFGAEILVPGNGSLGVGSVIVLSILGSLICLGLYLVIRGLNDRPGKWLQRIGLPLLLLSLLLPLIVPNANVLTVLTLGAMLIVIGLPFIRAYARLSRDMLLKSG